MKTVTEWIAVFQDRYSSECIGPLVEAIQHDALEDLGLWLADHCGCPECVAKVKELHGGTLP